MHFFESVNEVLSKNKITSFPEVGLEFLKTRIPEDKNLAEFHQNLVSFIMELIPSKTDVAVRQHIVDTLCLRIKEALLSYRSKVIILPSGSCMNGTFLPCADIDLAIFFFPSPCKPIEVMEFLMAELDDIAIDGFNPLPQARVPVLKFKISPGISIDISFDELQGPLNVLAVRKIFETMPYLLPAQVFLKAILHRSFLDQPYKGGISSYTLQLMLVAYVQHTGEPKNLTELIVGFCNFYGNVFNFTLTGIDVSGSGRFFSRYKEDSLSLETPAAMYICDPFNSNNILGLNAFRMNEIREEFRNVYENITNGEWKTIMDSLSGELAENRKMHIINNKFAQENGIKVE